MTRDRTIETINHLAGGGPAKLAGSRAGVPERQS
jgi:hypothetical protein